MCSCAQARPTHVAAEKRASGHAVRVTCAGLLGCNWLYLLDSAKRRVLQPGAAVHSRRGFTHTVDSRRGTARAGLLDAYLLDLAKRRGLQPGAANASPCGGSTRVVDSRHSTARAGLLGCNWLYLLDLAKRRVLQPGAAVVPAGATLFCAGVQALTGNVSGFDFSGLNTYRRTPSRDLSKVTSLLSLPDRQQTCQPVSGDS